MNLAHIVTVAVLATLTACSSPLDDYASAILRIVAPSAPVTQEEIDAGANDMGVTFDIDDPSGGCASLPPDIDATLNGDAQTDVGGGGMLFAYGVVPFCQSTDVRFPMRPSPVDKYTFIMADEITEIRMVATPGREVDFSIPGDGGERAEIFECVGVASCEMWSMQGIPTMKGTPARRKF